MQAVYLVKVKAPADSHYPWDYLTIVKTIPGERAFMPASESVCGLLKR